MRLELFGMRVVIPQAGFAGADLVAYREGRTCAIQVKTRAHADMVNWLVDGSRLDAPFLVLVRLNAYRMRKRPLRPSDPTHPAAYVLPLEVALDAWYASGRAGRKMSGIYMYGEARRIVEPYLEAWWVIREFLDQQP